MIRVLLALLIAGLAGCTGFELRAQHAPSEPVHEEVAEMTLELTSGAFAEGNAIPTRYSCQGEDMSPPLAWQGAPAATQSFALIMDDPDAPGQTWVHWIVYNLPATTHALPEGVTAGTALSGNAAQGRNSWGRNDYGGPCPPSGTHRYFFKLYALDSVLELPTGASKDDVLHAMEGHILAETQLMGTYRK